MNCATKRSVSTFRLMADAAPAIFIYAGRYEYAVSQRVHGVHLNVAIEPYDRFEYVTDWYVNTTG